MDRLDLTETVRIDTGIPFPHLPSDGQDRQQQRGETIIAEVCSEFTEYRAQVEYLKKNGLLRLVHDKDSLPIAFTISENQSLCALRHGTHDGEGWLSLDITPVDCIATTFDVMQVEDTLYITVACKTSKDAETHSLYYCTVDISSPDFKIENEAVAQKGGRKGMQWVVVPDNTKDGVGAVAIASLLCKVVLADNANALNSFQIIVSTAQHGDRTATIYTVNPAAVGGVYWTASSFPFSATLLVQTEPLILGHQGAREEGLVSVARDPDVKGRLRCAGQRCASTGGFTSSWEYKAGKLGDLRSAYSHLNIFGFTDVFIAGEKGIGFFSWKSVDFMTVDPILKDVGFKQVVASEAEDPDHDGQSKLAIFAVSDDDCLYFIEGTRDYSDATIKYKFEASGFPIRKGVTHLAARFNPTHGTNELLYASTEENALFFLRRTAHGASWVEDKIARKALQHTKYDAFVTSIVLTDGHGTALPADRSISVTADSLQAVVNGRARTLSSQPTSAAPDATGCVLIAVPSASRLACSPFQVSVSASGGAHTFSVDPAQRITRLLSTYDSPEKLRDAKSSTGQPVLAGMSHQQLTDAASLLGKYSSAKRSIENPGSAPAQQPAAPAPDEADSWLDKAVDGVEKSLSEAIEMVKKVVKAGVKIFIRVFGPVIKLVLVIAGKIIKWVVTGLYSLLEVIGSGLELIWGYDGLSKFLKALKLAIDPKEIAKTQKFLSDVISGGLKVASRGIVATKHVILDAIAESGEYIKQYVDDPRVPARPFSMPGWIQKLLNNPLTRLLSKINPLGWVLEALFEEIPDLKLPDISRLFDKVYTVFEDLFKSEASLLQQLWESLFKQILVASSEPSRIIEAILNALKSVFWSFWDMATLFIEKALDCMSIFLDELGELLTETWNIPGLTDSWEDLTEQKFTLLGFVTFVPAAIINMGCALTESRLPHFDAVDLDSINVESFFQSTSTTSNRRQQEQQSSAEKGEMVHPVKLQSIQQHPTHLNLMMMPNAMAMAPSIQHPTHLNLNMKMAGIMAKAPPIQPITGDPKKVPAPPAPPAPPAADKKEEEDEWAMPHWYELIFEDLGKTYSGCWNSFDSISSVIVDYKNYKAAPANNPPPAVQLGPIGVGPGAVIGQNVQPQTTAQAANKWWKVLRGLGKVLQGGALVFSAVVTTRNTAVNKKKHTAPKVAVAVLGIGEVAFFLASVTCVSSATEEILNIVADFCGSAGTVVRCVDDNEWDGEAIAETAGSTAVVITIVADQVKKRDFEPVTKVCIGAAGATCAVADTICSIYGLYKCTKKCFPPKKK
ncbi:hypothetical protein DFH27DRAFT_650780 [Peziza echinospora]|nr:hypothetical protein DFH27DRAFT_650780 [Peziza echinospora]